MEISSRGWEADLTGVGFYIFPFLAEGAEEAEEAEGVQKSDFIFNYVDLVIN